MNPNDAYVYANRGIAYFMLRNMGRTISDFQKACDLGFEKGCELLQMFLKNK